MRLPITAWASITHRATGVLLFAGVAIFLWALDTSLASPEGFNQIGESLSSPWLKLVIWVVLSALIYHTAAGVRHLIMDLGIGETMAGGVLGARLVVAFSVVFILLAGIWLW